MDMLSNNHCSALYTVSNTNCLHSLLKPTTPASSAAGSGLWAQLKGGKLRHQALGSGGGRAEGKKTFLRTFLFASSAPSMLYHRDIHYPVLYHRDIRAAVLPAGEGGRGPGAGRRVHGKNCSGVNPHAPRAHRAPRPQLRCNVFGCNLKEREKGKRERKPQGGRERIGKMSCR